MLISLTFPLFLLSLSFLSPSLFLSVFSHSLLLSLFFFSIFSISVPLFFSTPHYPSLTFPLFLLSHCFSLSLCLPFALSGLCGRDSVWLSVTQCVYHWPSVTDFWPAGVYRGHSSSVRQISWKWWSHFFSRITFVPLMCWPLLSKQTC